MSPIRTAQARFAPKDGSKAQFELQASTGTSPYLPGTAVVQVGMLVLVVPDGVSRVVGVGVAMAGDPVPSIYKDEI